MRCATALLLELELVLSSHLKRHSVSIPVHKCLFTSAIAPGRSTRRAEQQDSCTKIVKRYHTNVPSFKADEGLQSENQVSSSCNQQQRNPALSTSDPKIATSIANTQTQFYRRPLPNSCISFGSIEGMKLFAEAQASGYMFSYFPLASQFRTQDEPAFCGLSSLVMALNALEVDPQRVWKAPWRFYHENMLDCCVPLETVERAGITMDQFACLAACNTLHVKMVQANTLSQESDFRSAVKSVTQCTDQVIIASYSRSSLDQTGDGHFSPIGGYHPDRDLVLIMDTARFKYPPHWVSLSRLFGAMQITDKASGMPRGYFILTKARVAPAILYRLSSSLSPLVLEQSSSGMFRFLQAWQAWLLQPARGIMGVEVVELAILRLLDLVELLEDNSSIMTTHSTMSAEDDIEITRREAVLDSIRRLVDFTQKLDIYRLVEGFLASCKTDERKSIAKFGTRGDVVVQGDTMNASAENASETVSSHVVEQLSQSRIDLKPSDFLVMLLLSWPYHRCNSDTYGLSLQKYSTSQMSAVKCHGDFELLQNETARLRQHLSNIINFTCRLKHCHHSN